MCQRQGIVEADQGLLRVPQQPENSCSMDPAANTWILTNAEHWRTALWVSTRKYAILDASSGQSDCQL
ncbi:MAG TPA: hypothetical protein VIH59_10570 [Candidatus Tectomicrobia bacterium]